MHTPRVELLWWEGCPSTQRALEELRHELHSAGLGDADVQMREIATDDEAEQADFKGSPTILVNGVDVVPLGGEEPAGLSCRVYHRRDGAISPTPDPHDIRNALLRAGAPETGGDR